MSAGMGTASVQSYVNRLLADIKRRWPVPREEAYHAKIERHRAFRESDGDYLRPTNWSADMPHRRDYIVDPLGERIPYVWSDLLFGADPEINATKKSDKTKLDEMVNANNLPSELQRAEWICSSEGEVWYRITPDEITGHANIEWLSRLVTVPLWIGKMLAAVAFVSELDRDKDYVWRYVEIHAKGTVVRKLFKGKAKGKGMDSIGEELALTDRPETSAWDPQWDHGLDMLAGRIVNKLGADLHMGVSDFDGIEDLLLALNEITTIGQENARLTAKQRAIVPQRFLDMQGNLPRGLEILIATEVDQDPEKIKNDVAMVEFSFDAAALIAYTEHITDRVLTRARVAPQLVGRHTEGAQTGPALRARVLDSVLAANGKGKAWDDEAPRVLQKGAQVENLSTGQGGLGIKWADTKNPPTFKRASALPEDPETLSRRLAIEVNAEILSRKSAIQLSHPEWDATRVQDEVDQIILETGGGIDAPPKINFRTGGLPNARQQQNDAPLDGPGAVKVPSNQPPSPVTGSGKAERANGAVRARA